MERFSLDGVPAFLLRPAETDTKTTVIYFHGGCFAIGSTAAHFPWIQQLAVESNSVVFSVDYALAPEHPFPNGTNDAIKATNAVFKLSRQLNIKTDKVILAGDSAGANIVASVAFDFAKNGRSSDIKGIILGSPMLQIADMANIPSYRKYGKLQTRQF